MKGGEVGINRLLARLRHVFSWAIEQGYVNETPFKRARQTVIKLATRVETPGSAALWTMRSSGYSPTRGGICEG